MDTQKEEAWFVLNDGDVIDERIVAVFKKLFIGSNNYVQINCDRLADQLKIPMFNRMHVDLQYWLQNELRNHLQIQTEIRPSYAGLPQLTINMNYLGSCVKTVTIKFGD